MRAFIVVFLGGFLLDQQPEAIRVNSQLVEINVVALNRTGQPVGDLTKDDFEILDNGKPQEVRFFALEAKTEHAAAPAPLPGHVFSNKTLGKVATAPAVSVVLFDLLNTEFADQANAKQQLLSLMHKVQPGERIGVYVLGREVGVLHDFTDDPRQLAAVLARFEGRPSPELAAIADAQARPVDLGAAADRFAEAERLLKGGQNVQKDYFNVDRATITLSALKDIARHLARQPGRKSLVWISGSFPFTLGVSQQDLDELAKDSPNRERGSFQALFESAMRAVSDANMAIYPVDARGLIPSSIYDAGNPAGSPGGYSRTDERNRPLYSPPNLDSMENLANKSGGRAFFNANDLQQSISTALADNRVTYTLAFSPASAPDNKFHVLKVTVRRKDVNLRYRQGYLAASRSARPSDPRAILKDAVVSPLEASAIGITVKAEVPKSADGAWQLVTTVDSHDLAVAEQNGKWVGHLQVLYSVQAETGKELGGTLDDVNLDLKPEIWAHITTDGLPMRKEFQAPPNAFKIRIAVCDVSTGRLGSISIPLTHVPQGK
jgi:VWFA-related protein